MKKYIIINNKKFDYEFSNSELQILKSFFKEVMHVNNLPSTKKISTTIKISLSNMKVKGIPPPIEEKNSFLHMLRPLILQKEATWTPKVINILYKHIDSELFREFLNTQKSFFKCKDPYSLSYTIDEGKIYNEKILKLWLNAYEYHRDIKKIEELKAIIKPIGMETFETQMMDMIILKFNSTLAIAQYVEILINDDENNFKLNIE